MMGDSPEVLNVNSYFSNPTGSSVTRGQFPPFWGGGGNLEYIYMGAFGKNGSMRPCLTRSSKPMVEAHFVAP